MPPYKPEGLTGQELVLLMDCFNKNELLPGQLMAEAENHVESAREAYQTGEKTNVRLAEAIVNVFRTIIADWDQIPVEAQKWCLGMICYFALANDELDDFASPIGFEDDAEVVNACMKMIGRTDLMIDLEEYESA